MISFQKAVFIGSFPKYHQLPADQGREIAMVGRSNVGKSSLINALTGRKKLAKSSSTPGKTREIVLFDLLGDCRLADLPGYGYARVSHTEQRLWAREMTQYLMERESLIGIVQIMDYRHPLSEKDKEMLHLLREAGKAIILVLNKEDKLKQSERVKNLKKVENYLKELRFNAVILPLSAQKAKGIDALRKLLSQWFEG